MKDKDFPDFCSVDFETFKHKKKEATKMMLTKIVEQGAYEASPQEIEHAKKLLTEYWDWKNKK